MGAEDCGDRGAAFERAEQLFDAAGERWQVERIVQGVQPGDEWDPRPRIPRFVDKGTRPFP